MFPQKEIAQEVSGDWHTKNVGQRELLPVAQETDPEFQTQGLQSLNFCEGQHLPKQQRFVGKLWIRTFLASDGPPSCFLQEFQALLCCWAKLAKVTFSGETLDW